MITIIIEYAWIGLNKQVLNVTRNLNMPKFWILQTFEYGRILHMQVLHSILNMPEYALSEFWIYLGF